MTQTNPPGQPGIAPRWTSSAKSGVGTAATNASRIWFTLSHGIVNEVYHPTLDQANTRDLGFLVADGGDFFSEEKRDALHQISPLAPGAPGYQVVNECEQGRYQLTKTIFTDPTRDVLIQQVRFKPLKGKLADYTLCALLAPHVGNRGAGNDGWAGDYKGVPMLFAKRENTTIALACSVPWRGRSCGYVGVSDGWRDLRDHKRMTWHHPSARDGNIALTGEIDLASCGGEFTLVLAIDAGPDDAGQQARATLLANGDDIRDDFIEGWQRFQKTCVPLKAPCQGKFDIYRVSTAVLRTHSGKRFEGGIIASLSIPWGFSRGDGDISGYHMVWPRDQVEAAGALLASGNADGARDTLLYLMSVQEADGHWPQNMWLNGSAGLPGVQSDETALVILLASALKRGKALGNIDPTPAIRKAATFLVRKGPATEQDRWEENSGLSVYTLAVEIAALLAAADFADDAGDKEAANYLRQTADIWNAHIEKWTYVTGTELAKSVGVEGYYVRITPQSGASDPRSAAITLKNLPEDRASFPVSEIVSPDALALVRYGLRAPDDPRIVNTVKAIDATLKTDTTTGPGWHRYTHDGYGEHDDGAPFDGTGVGRLWPLLAGERAHYEIAAGNRKEAERLQQVMADQTSPGALLPEQIWDSADIEAHGLRNGQPTGSGMPLVWAHAEYVKLARSLKDGSIFDQPPQTIERYITRPTPCCIDFWRYAYQCESIPSGSQLRIELEAAATVHWTTDSWRTVCDDQTCDTGMGLHIVDLPTEAAPVAACVTFTFHWLDADRWEGRNYHVKVDAAD